MGDGIRLADHRAPESACGTKLSLASCGAYWTLSAPGPKQESTVRLVPEDQRTVALRATRGQLAS